METKTETKPKVSTYKSPKTRQVQAYYQLLCDIGLDEYVQNVLELRNKKLAENGKKPVSAEDQKKGADIEVTEQDAIEVYAKIDLGKMMNTLAQSGKLIDFVSIVMDCSPEEAEEVTMDEFAENFTYFAAGSLKPISSLLSFGQIVG